MGTWNSPSSETHLGVLFDWVEAIENDSWLAVQSGPSIFAEEDTTAHEFPVTVLGEPACGSLETCAMGPFSEALGTPSNSPRPK